MVVTAKPLFNFASPYFRPWPRIRLRSRSGAAIEACRVIRRDCVVELKLTVDAGCGGADCLPAIRQVEVRNRFDIVGLTGRAAGETQLDARAADIDAGNDKFGGDDESLNTAPKFISPPNAVVPYSAPLVPRIRPAYG